ncbi:MAG TPA: hypothetical protein VII96_11915 [Acidimicrobiales bacterium]
MILDEPVAPRPAGTGDPGGTGDPDGTSGTASGGAPGAASEGSTADPDGTRADLVLVQRCAWTLVWVAVLAAALGFWGAWSAGPWAALLAPLLVLTALVGAVLVWTVPRPLSTSMQRFGLAAAVVTAAASEGAGIHLRHFYTTDSGAFNQVATRLLLDGRNPYTSSMAGAARLLHPASSYWTYQVDGVHTVKVSYPAASFLLQAPFMALGLHHMVTDWVDLAAWLVTAVLIFVMVPPVLRWLAPLLLLTGIFLGPFASGGTDALFVPFLVVAVWRWDRFPDRTAAWLPSWVGPASLGIACSVKQSPWFCLPFLMVGVACEARRAGRRPAVTALRYGAIAAAAFLVVNAAFLAWSPSAWLRGIFLPMVDPLVADGQGAVAIALHGLTGGVVMPWLSAAAGLALVAMLVAFALWEPRLKRAWLFLVPLVLFLPDRSLANYLSDFVPAALVAALSVATVSSRTGVRTGSRWPARLGIGAPALASLALLVVAFTSAPLEVSVDGVTVSGVATVDGGVSFHRVEVTVRNTSDRALTPHFMVSSGGGHPNAFWQSNVLRGTDPVAAGATTVFVLRPTTYFGAPPRGQRWLVAAYTASPNALSTSSLQSSRWGKPAP